MITLFVTTTEVDPVPFVVETRLGFVFTGIATNDTTTVVSLNNFYQVWDSDETKEYGYMLGISLWTTLSLYNVWCFFGHAMFHTEIR